MRYPKFENLGCCGVPEIRSIKDVAGQRIAIKRLIPIHLVLAIVTLCVGLVHSGQASTLYSGSISGNFANPVLSGNIINVDRSLSFLDNTSTAVFTGVGTNTFTWGTFPPGPVPPFSRFVFTGNTITNQPANTPFALGTFRFLNGTSALNSLVFGVTLNLSFSGNAAVTPDVSKLNIVTTANGGVDKFADADFVGFDKFPNTFNVFEGAESTATLVGEIVGDPQLMLLDITLPPNDPNGFLAQGQGSAVPEPGSFVLVSLGLAGACLILRLRAPKF